MSSRVAGVERSEPPAFRVKLVWGLAMLDPSHPIKSHPVTASGNAVEEPKPFVPLCVVANDVRAIDSANLDVINASRNLNVGALKVD